MPLLEEEPVDRVIVSATGNPRNGLTDDDWCGCCSARRPRSLILRPDVAVG